MRGMTSDTEEVLRKLDALDKRLAVIERHCARTASPRELLSFREAAKRLGISRGTTLRDLILDRRVRLAKVGGSVRIPASEIARVIKELQR